MTEVAFQLKQGLSKKDINQLAQITIEAIEEKGYAVQVAEQISIMEAYIKTLKADPKFTEAVRVELEKNSGKLTVSGGTKIETIEGGTKYHFDNCGDEQLRLLEIELESKEAELKKRKEFLKTIPAEGLEILTSEGEVLTLYPPYKTSASTYKVTLKTA